MSVSREQRLEQALTTLANVSTASGITSAFWVHDVASKALALPADAPAQSGEDTGPASQPSQPAQDKRLLEIDSAHAIYSVAGGGKADDLALMEVCRAQLAKADRTRPQL